MSRDNFLQRKKAVLSKQDKSSKGSWDEKIKFLCEKINKMEDYYTTSSCSGRIVLMIEQDKKAEGLFLKVWHEEINFEELKKELEKICSQVRNLSASIPHPSDPDKGNKKSNTARFENIKFKQEPCVLHVACRNLEDAFYILNKAKKVGWKRSGIISEGRRFIVEIVSTEKLEFPIIVNGKLIVDDNFLKIIIKKSNENLKKSWEKIGKLEKEVLYFIT